MKINPKDPLKACIDEVMKTLKGNNIVNWEEFTNFVKNLCIESGVSVDQTLKPEW